jgi:hypothetical protein
VRGSRSRERLWTSSMVRDRCERKIAAGRVAWQRWERRAPAVVEPLTSARSGVSCERRAGTGQEHRRATQAPARTRVGCPQSRAPATTAIVGGWRVSPREGASQSYSTRNRSDRSSHRTASLQLSGLLAGQENNSVVLDRYHPATRHVIVEQVSGGILWFRSRRRRSAGCWPAS